MTAAKLDIAAPATAARTASVSTPTSMATLYARKRRARFGEVPLSTGEVEYLSRKDEAARRQQRLLEVRNHEKRIAQLVTQRYRDNLRRLHAHKLQSAQQMHMQQQDATLGALHTKYRDSLQNAGSAQRQARAMLAELAEAALTEQAKWTYNDAHVTKARSSEAARLHDDERAAATAKQRDVALNLQRLKEASATQRAQASIRARREHEKLLALAQRQAEAAEFRRRAAPQHEVTMARRGRNDVDAYQFTRSHCAVAVDPSTTTQRAPEVKVVRHNRAHTSADKNGIADAAAYRDEVAARRERERQAHEVHAARAEERGESAHARMQSQHDGACAFAWLAEREAATYCDGDALAYAQTVRRIGGNGDDDDDAEAERVFRRLLVLDNDDGNGAFELSTRTQDERAAIDRVVLSPLRRRCDSVNPADDDSDDALYSTSCDDGDSSRDDASVESSRHSPLGLAASVAAATAPSSLHVLKRTVLEPASRRNDSNRSASESSPLASDALKRLGVGADERHNSAHGHAQRSTDDLAMNRELATAKPDDDVTRVSVVTRPQQQEPDLKPRPSSAGTDYRRRSIDSVLSGAFGDDEHEPLAELQQRRESLDALESRLQDVLNLRRRHQQQQQQTQPLQHRVDSADPVAARATAQANRQPLVSTAAQLDSEPQRSVWRDSDDDDRDDSVQSSIDLSEPRAARTDSNHRQQQQQQQQQQQARERRDVVDTQHELLAHNVPQSLEASAISSSNSNDSDRSVSSRASRSRSQRSATRAASVRSSGSASQSSRRVRERIDDRESIAFSSSSSGSSSSGVAEQTARRFEPSSRDTERATHEHTRVSARTSPRDSASSSSSDSISNRRDHNDEPANTVPLPGRPSRRESEQQQQASLRAVDRAELVDAMERVSARDSMTPSALAPSSLASPMPQGEATRARATDLQRRTSSGGILDLRDHAAARRDSFDASVQSDASMRADGDVLARPRSRRDSNSRNSSVESSEYERSNSAAHDRTSQARAVMNNSAGDSESRRYRTRDSDSSRDALQSRDARSSRASVASIASSSSSSNLLAHSALHAESDAVAPASANDDDDDDNDSSVSRAHTHKFSDGTASRTDRRDIHKRQAAAHDDGVDRLESSASFATSRRSSRERSQSPPVREPTVQATDVSAQLQQHAASERSASLQLLDDDSIESIDADDVANDNDRNRLYMQKIHARLQHFAGRDSAASSVAQYSLPLSDSMSSMSSMSVVNHAARNDGDDSFLLRLVPMFPDASFPDAVRNRRDDSASECSEPLDVQLVNPALSRMFESSVAADGAAMHSSECGSNRRGQTDNREQEHDMYDSRIHEHRLDEHAHQLTASSGEQKGDDDADPMRSRIEQYSLLSDSSNDSGVSSVGFSALLSLTAGMALQPAQSTSRSRDVDSTGNARASRRSSVNSTTSAEHELEHLARMRAAVERSLPLPLPLPAMAHAPVDMRMPPAPLHWANASSSSSSSPSRRDDGDGDGSASESEQQSGRPAAETAPNRDGHASAGADAHLLETSRPASLSDAAVSALESDDELLYESFRRELLERSAQLPPLPIGDLDRSRPPQPLILAHSESLSSRSSRASSSRSRQQVARSNGDRDNSVDDNSSEEHKANESSLDSSNSNSITKRTDSVGASASLADAFRQRHPRFQQRVDANRAELRRKREALECQREQQQTSTHESNTRDRNRNDDGSTASPALVPAQQQLLERLAVGERAYVSPVEMHARTRRLYNQLPEVVARKRQDELVRRRQQRLAELRDHDKARRLEQKQRREQQQKQRDATSS